MTRDQIEARIAQLEKRIDTLESIEAIKALHRRYVRTVGDRDWAAAIDFFSETATTDIRAHGISRGREELRRLLVEDLGPTVLSKDAYVLHAPLIDVDGDRATGQWDLIRHISEMKTTRGEFPPVRVWGVWLAGRYTAEYAREDGVWRFERIHFRYHAPDPDPE